MIKKFMMVVVFLFYPVIIFAAHCIHDSILHDQRLYFFKHYLGKYTIYLQPTLTAIETNRAGKHKPYYRKIWYGNCPKHLSQNNTCIEFTVYPDSTNFYPGNIMKKIERYTHDGKPDRGEVRILTNFSQDKYVYTIDHEKHFCGPYGLS